jgi:UDP-N-acetylglucosamine--N-acetylmuramyl-(pentapeptide) pyrophosphoryl-undecaprenol N-acetylglucosamine transferase
VKVILAGGGTGGHVYPSLSVARALEAETRSRGDALGLLYIGIRGRIDEQIVPRSGIEFRAVAAGALRVSSPLTFAVNIAKLALGTLQSTWIMLRYRPNAVFATGGYASVPVGIAARIMRRPLVVYLPDVTPGWAVRLLSRLATRMTTTSERALAHLPAKKTSVVGYPVREEFWSIDRTAARAKLGLPADATVLLVTGASLGARTINDAVFAALPRLLERCYVVHLAGSEDEGRAADARSRLTEDARVRYIVRGFTDDMPAALVAADLVVSRSGASTLGELPAAGVASILIPGEYEGWSQAPNAEFLESAGAAVVLRNSELDRLADTVLSILNDSTRLQSMRDASRRLARPEAARDLARILLQVAA